MAASVALASESCRASAASGYHDLHLHLQRLQLDLKARVQTVGGKHCNYLPAGFLPGPQAPPALLPPDPIPGMTQRRSEKCQTRSACNCKSSTLVCKAALAASCPAGCDKALYSQHDSPDSCMTRSSACNDCAASAAATPSLVLRCSCAFKNIIVNEYLLPPST